MPILEKQSGRSGDTVAGKPAAAPHRGINLDKSTPVFYAIAIVICIGAYLYLQSVYNPPQPQVVIMYNALAQTGNGFITNTLSFPINITYFYCTVPGGMKYEFKNPPQGTLNPGSKTGVSIVASNVSIRLPADCGDWKVYYNAGPLSPANVPLKNLTVIQQHQGS